MLKKYKLIGLGCAHCAEKMEREIQKIKGVDTASVIFMTSKLLLDAEESKHPEILAEAQRVITKIEKNCKIEV